MKYPPVGELKTTITDATLNAVATTKIPPPLVGIDLREMEGNVAVELFKECYAVADQDGHDQLRNLVSEPLGAILLLE